VGGIKYLTTTSNGQMKAMVRLDAKIRDHYAAACGQWSGNTCEKPWIKIPREAATDHGKSNGCWAGTDHDLLRPMWNGDVQLQGRLWCWIMTGDTAGSFVTGGPGQTLYGWMYASTGTSICDASQRRYEQIETPFGEEQTWSFDIISWSRSGTFSKYTCSAALPDEIK